MICISSATSTPQHTLLIISSFDIITFFILSITLTPDLMGPFGTVHSTVFHALEEILQVVGSTFQVIGSALQSVLGGFSGCFSIFSRSGVSDEPVLPLSNAENNVNVSQPPPYTVSCFLFFYACFFAQFFFT